MTKTNRWAIRDASAAAELWLLHPGRIVEKPLAKNLVTAPLLQRDFVEPA
jgi:hypothetical protein